MVNLSTGKLCTWGYATLLLSLFKDTTSFTLTPPTTTKSISKTKTTSTTSLSMVLDPITTLRTEWVAAALCTNQIPRDSKSVLQLGSIDGRAVNFIPRTVEELYTSTLETDGEIPIGVQRQLKDQNTRRGAGLKIQYVDQRADDLSEMEDESVDIVVSLQAAESMRENGLDWKNAISEAGRVLKGGGRFLFLEMKEIDGVDYLETVMSLAVLVGGGDDDEEDDAEKEVAPIFDVLGYDDVDFVLVPHIAGIVTKNVNAGLTKAEIEARDAQREKDRLSDLSISAFERGLKKRKRKKNKKATAEDEEVASN